MTPLDDAQHSCRYRLIAEIGRGGMGEVFLALASGVAGFRKLVVLKQARPDLADEPEFLSMFLDEARLAARLNHPNVVQSYEAGQDEGRYFIAMEYLDGQPLHRIRSRVEPHKFPVVMQVRILIEALAGLHHAHELTDFDGTPLEVVHRDATPQNIFVTYDGQIKVVDFGIAKGAGSMMCTRAGMIRGKVPYMAPEQARREPIDRRADVFAVGVMLWEAITGERMWKGLTDTQIIRRLAMGRLRDLDAELPSCDPELKRILRRALAHTRTNRYSTAAEFQRDLEFWLVQQGEEVPARSVGAFVAAHFEEERASIKALLEQELRDCCSNSTLRRVMGVGRPASKLEETMRDSRPGGRRAPFASAEFSVTLTAPAEVSPLIQAVTMAAERSPRGPAADTSQEGQFPATLRSPSALSTEDETPPTARVFTGTCTEPALVLPPLAPPPPAAPAFEEAPLPSPPKAESQERSVESQERQRLTPLSLAPVVEAVPARKNGRWLSKALAAGSAFMIAATTTALVLSLHAPASWRSRSSEMPFDFMETAHAASFSELDPTAAESEPSGEIDLNVSVSPRTARIFLDGAPVSIGKHQQKLVRDGRVHWIHVEAPSFVPIEQSITATGDVSVSFSLERQAVERQAARAR